MEEKQKLDSGHYIGWIILCMLFSFSILRACAQQAKIDTVVCKTECIKKIIESKTAKSVKYFAIYNDYKNDISELIPIPKTTLEYINLCKANGIKPALGIKLKNNQIVSIIKYKRRYVKK